MTINSTSRKAGPFNGTGAQTVFPFTFKIFVPSDLRVVLTDAAGVESDQVLNAAYSVVINADQENIPGGSVTMLAAPPVGTRLTITSVVPITQGQSIPNNSGFYPKVIENAYDRLTIICQQLAEQVTRSVKFAISDTTSGNNFPTATARANNLLGFDSDGNMVAVAPAAQSATALQTLLATLTGSSLIGFIAAGAGALLRTSQSKMRDFVNASDYPTLTAAFTASDTVFVTSANYAVAAGVTIPKTKQLVILAGGSLNLAGALTINGAFSAPIRQVFYGAGTVTGIRQVYPEWWGAKGDGTGDDQPALQAAHDCIIASVSSTGVSPTVFLTSSLYQVANTWTLTPDTGIAIAVVGVGRGMSWLTPTSTFPAAPVVLVDGNAANHDTEFTLQNWGIIPNGGGIGAATAGLQIGSENPLKKLSSTNPSRLENLYVAGFPKCYYVCHARMLQWHRVAGWNNLVTTANSALYITQKGAFTGDMTFNACQFVSNITNAASTTVSIISTGGVATAGGAYTVSGIRFSDTIFYQSAKQMYLLAQNGALLNDIWISPGCQFDGGSTNAIYMQCDTATSFLRNVNVNGCYFSGAITGDTVSLVGGGGKLTDCTFNNNFMNGSSARTFTIFSSGGIVSGHTFTNNRVTENNNNTGPAIEINGPISNVIISGNVANRVTGNFFKYFVTIQAGVTQFVLAGNNSGAIGATAAINDLSGAVTKAVANNI